MRTAGGLLICAVAIAAILIALAVTWFRPMFRCPPYVWAAQLCLRTGQRPGTHRFWKRYKGSPVFVIQTNDAQGRVLRVTVLAPTYGDDELKAINKDDPQTSHSVAGGIEEFRIDLSPYQRGKSLRASNVDVRAEIRPGIGVVFVAERGQLSDK